MKNDVYFVTLVSMVASACTHMSSTLEGDCSRSHLDKQLLETVKEWKTGPSVYPTLPLQPESKEEVNTKFGPYLKNIENTLSRLNTEREEIRKNCGATANSTIKKYTEQITSLASDQEIVSLRQTQDLDLISLIESRTKHFADQNLVYSDRTVSVKMLDIREIERAVMIIKLKFDSNEKYKVLPLSIVETFLYKNDRGGESVGRILKGTTVSDEYSNIYDVKVRSESEELRPGESLNFEFVSKVPIKNAKFVVIKIEKNRVSNSKPILFRVKRFEGTAPTEMKGEH